MFLGGQTKFCNLKNIYIQINFFQVGEVTGVMKQNMEKVMERGDKLDDLVDKSEQLEQGVSIKQLNR